VSILSSLNIDMIRNVISKYFLVKDMSSFVDYVEVVVVPKGGLRKCFNELYAELTSKFVYPMLFRSGDEYRIRIQAGKVSRRRVRLQIILFIATVVTTVITAYFWVTQYFSFLSSNLGVTYSMLDIILSIILFVFGVLVPLGLHELGHWLISRRVRVPVSLPYFIPAPPVISLGTFGAVINMRFLPPTLDELALIGVSGPLFGIIFSSVTSALGLYLSQPVEVGVLEELAKAGKVELINFSTPLFTLIFRAMWGDTPVLLHPIAQVGLLLFIIHFLNLLPIGQLDGGHVVRSVTSMKVHYLIGISVAILGILSVFIIRSFITQLISIFSLLALLLSGFRPHLGCANQVTKPSPKAYIALALYLILLALTFPIVE